MNKTLPTVKVTASLVDQQGNPVHRAVVTMRLTTTERCMGYVVPREVRATTAPDGKAVLEVWPNELGSESSEYQVTILFPEPCAANGTQAGNLPPLRSIRGHATVPNADCNLQDIMELPPYEPRGSGQVISAEVAGWAAAAGKYADSAQTALSAAQSVETRLNATADAAVMARKAAEEFAVQASAAERRATALIDGVDADISHFRNTVVAEVDKTANRLTTDATACISQHRASALEAIDQRAGEVMSETTQSVSAARSESVQAIRNAGHEAVDEISAAGKSEIRSLRDEAALFGEDFENLTERAEAAAKRAGCSGAAASNAASKACACADSAEHAAVEVAGAKEAILEAARQAVTAGKQAAADAQRAESAQQFARIDAESAAESRTLAHKYAQGAREDAAHALASRVAADDARKAAESARDVTVNATADIDRALTDKAVEALTPQIVTEAVELATKTAAEAANKADISAKDAAQSLAGAEQAAEYAENAQTAAEKARDVAEELAGKLLKDYHFELHAMELSTQLVRLADRITKVELDHVHGVSSGVSSMSPGGYEFAPGVTVAPLTISRVPMPVEGAALTAFVEPYNPPTSGTK